MLCQEPPLTAPDAGMLGATFATVTTIWLFAGALVYDQATGINCPTVNVEPEIGALSVSVVATGTTEATLIVGPVSCIGCGAIHAAPAGHGLGTRPVSPVTLYAPAVE